MDNHETDSVFPLHFVEYSPRDIEEEDDDENDDDDNDTAHGSNTAISSLFTNFGRVRPKRQERSN